MTNRKYKKEGTKKKGLTNASVMFSHIKQIPTTGTLITAPCILTLAVSALTSGLFLALIHIYSL